ncbi:MAG TPA: hypothetical protein VFW40_14215 [Capsulimonadaceae bacterium]|nr:hypothetical protein [Capsulimonadaceae bacterium]
MAKKVVIPVVLLLVVAVGAFVLISMKHPPAKGAQIPPGFAAIKVGMSESQVVSLVGQPLSKSRYAKYEKRSPQYWEALQKKVDAASGSPVYGDAPSLDLIRARTELTHRDKDVWQYKPSSRIVMNLYFGDDGTLLNTGVNAAGGAKGMGGPGPSGPGGR